MIFYYYLLLICNLVKDSMVFNFKLFIYDFLLFLYNTSLSFSLNYFILFIYFLQTLITIFKV